MMKKTLLFLFVVAYSNLFGQLGNFDKDNIKGLREKTTCVILLDDDTTTYNEDIKAAVETHWTYSKYKFVKESEIINLLDSKDHTFLKLVKRFASSSVGGGGVAITSSSNYYSLDFFDGLEKINKYVRKLSEDGNNDKIEGSTEAQLAIRSMTVYEDFKHELALGVKLIQNMLVEVENGVKLKPMAKAAAKVFNKDIDLNSTTLVICDSLFHGFYNEDQIKAFYRYPFVLKSADEIKEMIAQNIPDHHYLMIGRNGNTWLEAMIVNIQSGEIVKYFSEIGFWFAYYHKKEKHRRKAVDLLLKGLKKATK